MMKLMRKQLSNQRGVTLIELLAVIVILGILAAVAVPAVMGQIGNSKVEADLANQQMLQDAIERYQVINSSYPNSIETLLSTGNGGPFIKEIPTLQQSGKSWSYNNITGAVSITP